MKAKKPFRFGTLGKKTASVIAASLSLLTAKEATAEVYPVAPLNEGAVFKNISKNRMLKPKLTLRLNPYRPENSLLANHSSHSSHSSHASHSSHSSGGYGSGGSSGGDGGGGLGILLAGGAIAYGIYRVSQSNKPGKK